MPLKEGVSETCAGHSTEIGLRHRDQRHTVCPPLAPRVRGPLHGHASPAEAHHLWGHDSDHRYAVPAQSRLSHVRMTFSATTAVLRA